MTGPPSRWESRSFTVPPAPPGARARAAAWLRSQARAGRQAALVLAATVLGALLCGLVVGSAGLLLQPRFTALELAAQRLAPRSIATQPPGEQVDGWQAFDRRYVTRFTVPDGGLAQVLERAGDQRWQVVGSRQRDGVVLEREGIRATLTQTGDVAEVRTRVAPWVRRAQRTAAWWSLIAGAAFGGLGMLLWLRRRPALRAAPLGIVRDANPGDDTLRHNHQS